MDTQEVAAVPSPLVRTPPEIEAIRSSNNNEYRIVMLGAGACGKSAITVQLCCHHFLEAYDPTIEDSYRTSLVVDGNPILLDILDTAGQAEYSALRDLYMRCGRGFVLVYAIDNRQSFASLPELHEQILRVWEVDDREPTENIVVPIVICANKCDLTIRSVTTDEGKQLAATFQASYFETSAKTGMNIEAAFFQIIRSIRALDEKLHPQTPTGRRRRFHLPTFDKCILL